MKKINILLTFICLFIVGIVNVNADTLNYVQVNGFYISGEENTITTDTEVSGSKILEKGKITYNVDNKELILDNVTINANTSDEKGVIFFVPGTELTIKLIGENIITNEGTGVGINSNGELIITGDGSLTINTKSYGIYAPTGNLSIKDVKLNVTSKINNAVEGYGVLTIDNSSLNLQSASYYSTFNGFASVTLENNNDRILKADRRPITTTTKAQNIEDFSSLATCETNRYLTLLNEYTITVDKDENSNVTLSNETVIEGSTVEATITTNKDYKLTSVLVNGVESIDSLVDGKLILTVNENTTIKVTSKAYEKEVEVPTIDTTKEVKEVTVGVKTDDTVNATLEKALEESDIDVSGFDSKVEIAVKNQNNNAVPEKDMESIKALVKTKENVKVSSYFDITINVVNTDNNQVIGTLPELSKELTFNVQLPTTLAKVEEGYTRTYYIIRYHNGKSEILDASVSGNTLTFKSDKFSTYALAYSDVKSEDKTIVDEDKTIIDKDKAEVKPAENPKTTDDGVVYILITLISILGIASECRFIKKIVNE